MKIKFTPSARGQFLDTIEHITEENPLGAQRLRARVEKELKRLIAFPNAGRRIPEFPELPHRKLVVNPYRVFYRVDEDVIWVVAFWRTSQDPSTPDAEGA